MERPINRRHALLSICAGLVSLVLWWRWRLRAQSTQELVMRVMRARAPYLHFSDSHLAQFADAYARHDAWRVASAVKSVPALRSYPPIQLSDAEQRIVTEMERHIVTSALLASDFFRTKMAQPQIVSFVAHPPTGCSPFARQS